MARRMASESLADSTKTSTSYDSSSATSKIQYPIHTKPLILQFTTVFRNDMDMIEVPSFYHRQWAPEYPELMARIADKVKTIDGSKETLKLAVRITELWFVGMPGRSEQAEMGDQIHVVCKQDQLKAWKMDLKEGCTYVMHNFRVSKNDGQYRVCDHPYKLTFIGVTTSLVSLMRLSFVIFHLEASKLTINEPVAPIPEFNQKLSELDIEIRSVLTRRSQWSSQPSGSAQLSSRETFISKSEAKSISEMNNLCEEFVCVTVGTITRIVMDNHSWCYASCIQCHKKIDVYTEPFVCPCGKHNDRVVLRYRVEVMVNYKDESTKFLQWYRECTELIEQLADEVNTLKIEDGDLDLNASPKALDKLLGHLLAFKTCSKIKATTPFDSNDPVHDESQSISITADHDPLIGLPLTPTKRQPFNECDDEARSSQISPA
ncbi:hypothetical protein GmHk_15G043978 [Glycine max]|nr:hypothetical protein GmHk_15G043978 [Glycine max]